MSLDIHFQIVLFLLFGWLLVHLLTEYLFRIEHAPRTWVHRACFLIYRPALRLEDYLHTTWLWHCRTAWLCELPLKLLPLPLCRIAMDIMQESEVHHD